MCTVQCFDCVPPFLVLSVVLSSIRTVRIGTSLSLGRTSRWRCDQLTSVDVRVGAERLAALVEAATGPGRAETHLAAMPNRAVVIRLLQNQASRAELAGRGRRALELYVRMTGMAPAYPHTWWERARLELVDNEIAAARASLGAMLEITRDPRLRRRVTETLDALPAA